MWSNVWRYLFTLDYASEAVLPEYGNELLVTNPAGTTIRVATGAGMCDGKFYENTANIDFSIDTPAPGNSRIDRVVLRKTMADQVVKAAIVTGVEGVAPVAPALTQVSATIYEVMIAEVLITDIPVVTVTDYRRFMRFVTAKVDERQGGSSTEWNTSGTTKYIPGYTRIELGANTVTIAGGAFTGTVVVTFPQAFGYHPVVFVSSDDADYIVQPTTISETQVTITATHRAASVGAHTVLVNWIAFGPRA